MIFHVTTIFRWNQAQSQGWLDADSLYSEGFIHMCYPVQLEGVLKRHFSGKTDLIQLTIDEESIKEMIKVEFSAGLNDGFPHCYGKIPVEAVTDTNLIKSSS